MIDKIIENINTSLSEIVEETFGLCSLVSGEKGTFPAYYDGNEFKFVTDFDSFYGGLSYIRKDGKIKHTYPESTTSNNLKVNLAIPLRLVLFVKKDIKEIDDAYESDRIAFKVIELVSTTNSSIRADIRASKVRILTTEHDTDSESVLKEEYQGEPKFIDPQYAYISISFDVEILIDKNCLNGCCL